MKTRAKALTLCLFRVLYQRYPELFRESLISESRLFLRREVFLPWRFQRTIDLEGSGGLNYQCLNSIRAGVERLKRNEVGLIPEASTVAQAAKLLEKHAADDHQLSIEEFANSHGPNFRFNLEIWA